MDRSAAANAVAQLLRALDHEPAGELAATPALVAEAWCEELLAGERLDAAAILREGALPVSADGLVLLRDLEVSLMCPHHLLPAHGRADVAYLPGAHVAGLGAIARALEACCRRLVLQEHAGQRMAELLVNELGARGASCRLRLQQTCLMLRGARQASALVETTALAGSFARAGAERDLALASLGAVAPATGEPCGARG